MNSFEHITNKHNTRGALTKPAFCANLHAYSTQTKLHKRVEEQAVVSLMHAVYTTPMLRTGTRVTR